ncbi:hypothetical protein HDU76_009779 [Blyttiomyces sp. JEL0837]|nr:hypothetical protein HDU76_009779 [Blyttiomyces sp. JEL0837]
MTQASPLHPLSTSFDSGFLPVSSIHSIAYSQYGNPKGRPIVYVHGGPGGGTTPDDSRYFDPTHYRIVLFDQRGSGKSTPSAELRENDTWSLVSDMEKLREHLGIDKWVVFGGSWGSTLALTYAIKHADRVKALILPVIVQGRYDMVCPAYTAWELHKKWPEAEFHLISDAGHSAKEKGTTLKLVEAAEKFQTL